MNLVKSTYCVQDGIGNITMNYPKNLNAIDLDMAKELLYLLSEAEQDPAVKVIVIRGGDKAFSAGGDIDHFYKRIEAGGTISIDDLIATVGQLFHKMKSLKKLIITSVLGAAAGAGAGLALAGDFVIAADNAKFIQAFANIGLAPDTGSAYLLCKAVGPQRTMDLCVTGRPMPAEEALSLGLVKEVCPKDELEEHTIAFAQKLAAGPLLSYQNIKMQVFEATFAGYEHFLKTAEGPAQSECAASEDFKEGVRAFIEKRKAIFQGQ